MRAYKGFNNAVIAAYPSLSLDPKNFGTSATCTHAHAHARAKTNTTQHKLEWM